MKKITSLMLAIFILTSCGIEEGLRRNEDRYAVRGALDFPLTGIYSTYQFNLLDRYRITHEWINSSGCEYGAERLRNPDGRWSNYYRVDAIYESNGVAKQVEQHPTRNFNRFINSWPQTSREKETLGETKDWGFEPMCFESWMRTSHSLRARLHRIDPATWRRMAQTQRNPDGSLPIRWRFASSPKAQWSQRKIGQHTWTVMEVDEKDLVEPPVNGVGGAYRAWLLPLADTGYTLSFELGANIESLKHPQAHAQFLATLQHLVESVKVEPLKP